MQRESLRRFVDFSFAGENQLSLAERKCGEQRRQSDGTVYVHLPIEQESESLQINKDNGVVTGRP